MCLLIIKQEKKLSFDKTSALTNSLLLFSYHISYQQHKMKFIPPPSILNVFQLCFTSKSIILHVNNNYVVINIFFSGDCELEQMSDDPSK